MVFVGSSWASASAVSKLAFDLSRLWNFSFRNCFLGNLCTLSVWKELSIWRPNLNIDLAKISFTSIPHYLILCIIELRLNIILQRRLQCSHILLRWLPRHTFNVLLYILILIVLYHILLRISRLLLRTQITQLILHLFLTRTNLQIKCFFFKFIIIVIFGLIKLICCWINLLVHLLFILLIAVEFNFLLCFERY